MVGKKIASVAVVFFIVHVCCANQDSDNPYFKKYLESFPLTNYENISTMDSNTSFPIYPRKYKKMRKKYLSGTYNISESYDDSENIRNMKNDGNYFVGFTKNPFGPSSPLPRSKYAKIAQEIPENNDENEHRLSEIRDKRGVLQLYNMVSCATGCDPISYKGYGCYCGFLGSGIITDSIDRCCMLHDLCYNHVNCPLFLEYFMPYLWKCWRGEPLCAIDHLGYGSVNSCAARLCECDRQLAVCLSYSPCPARRALCTSSPLRLLQNILMFK